MALSLSIKGVPEPLVDRLKRRAEQNHRSLQGELMTILEESVGSGPSLSVENVLQKLRRMNFSTPAESSSMIRHDRDER